MTKADKWLFKIVAITAIFSTFLLIILCVSNGCISIFDVINAYGIPLGLLAGWAIVMVIDEHKK